VLLEGCLLALLLLGLLVVTRLYNLLLLEVDHPPAPPPRRSDPATPAPLPQPQLRP
jgi:hypothetical protein